MKTFLLERNTWLPRPIDDIFAFFSDARNLQTLTPPWIGFRILTPGNIKMKAGALIDYEIRLHGLPLRWRTEIQVWEPPNRFVDAQLRGPYRSWVHEHRFEARDGGTMVGDIVEYSVLGGAVVNKLFVARDVARIFDYRTQKLAELFS